MASDSSWQLGSVHFGQRHSSHHDAGHTGHLLNRGESQTYGAHRQKAPAGTPKVPGVQWRSAT
jgi:hypothetical protein